MPLSPLLPTIRKRAVLSWTFLVLVGIALGSLASAPTEPGVPAGRIFPRVPAPPADWRAALYLLGVGSVRWYLVVLLVPLLVIVARKVNWAQQGRVAILGMATAALLALALSAATFEFFYVYNDAAFRPPFAGALTAILPAQLTLWFAVLAGVSLLEVRRRALIERAESTQLRAVIAEQRLVALTSQLQPHFLYNTLQSISTLIHRDPVLADRMLARLSDMLRDLLKHRDRVIVTLSDELEYSQRYLELSQLRYGERLTFSIQADAEVETAQVPLFILQPLLENAIAYSVGAAARPATISIRATITRARVVIDVIDNGVGTEAAVSRGSGMGLANVRDRLHAVFGDDQHFDLQPHAPAGTRARIDIPFRRSAAVSLP